MIWCADLRDLPEGSTPMNHSSSHQSLGRPSSLLAGRQREQALLLQLLDDMRAGSGSLVLVSGEAGIGKTTLVEWLASKAEAHGCLVLRGGCYDLTTTPPYGPWRELLRRYSPLSGLPTVPNFVSDPGALAALGSQEALFDEAWRFFEAIAEQQPILVILEDLHWADQVSLDLLRFIARQVRNVPTLLAVTYRDDELTRGHRLSQLLPLLVRESDTVRLALTRLDQSAISTMVDTRFGIDQDDRDRLVAWLTERTGGNPFFIEELLHELTDRKLVRDETSQWQLVDLDQIGVPLLLRQVIEGRLARLRPQARSLIELAAVIGQEVPLDVWQEINEAADNAFREGIEESVNAGLLTEMTNGAGWEFSHALVREAIYAQVPLLERRALHRHAAEFMKAASSTSPEAIAYHLKHAGDPRAFLWFLQAGFQARNSYAWRTAIDHLEQALALLNDNPIRIRDRGWICFHLGRLHQVSDPSTALRYFQDAKSLARDISDDTLLACVTFTAGVMHIGVMDFDAGFREMASGIHLFEQLPFTERLRMNNGDMYGPTMTGLWTEDHVPNTDLDYDSHFPEPLQRDLERRGILSMYLAGAGRLRDARNWLKPHIGITPSLFPVSNQPISFYLACAVLFGMEGDPSGAANGFRLVRDNRINRPPVSQLSEVWLHFDALVVPYQADNIPLRQHLIEVVERASQHSNDAIPPGWSTKFGMSMVSVVDGSWNELLSWTNQADIDHGPMLIPERIHAALAAIAYFQGRWEDCRAIIDKILPNGTDTEPGHHFILATSLIQRIASRLALDSGDLELARKWIKSYERWGEWSGIGFGLAEGSLLWAQYNQTCGNQTLARKYADYALALASDPRQPLALIAVHRFLGLLDSEARNFGQAEDHLQESLRLAEACAAPFERALTLLQMAELHLAQQRTDEARALLIEVRSICEPLEAKPTLAKVDDLARRIADESQIVPTEPNRLTAREIEVLRHAALGLTDREIAEQLCIGTRTVNSHMSSIFNKLGVNSRAAAAVRAIDASLI